MKRSGIIFLLLLIAGTIYIAFKQHTAPYQKCEGSIFGTYYMISYQSDKDLHTEILATLRGVDNSLSMFNKESTISKINAGETTETDGYINYIFPRAMAVSEATDGAFDITVAPLVNTWGFGFKKKQWPTEQDIDSIRQFVGYKKVALSNGNITKKDPRVMIDLSAIAKGYGVDVVSDYLNKAKVANFMVEIGGEVRTKGVNEKNMAWRVGVSKPMKSETDNTTRSYQCILSLSNRATATSGNYQNFFVKDGIRYAHTIDPRTGHPVQHDILSATVIAPSCHEADAFATAFMVLGLDKTKKVLSQQKQLEAYIIYNGKEGEDIWMTDGMKQYIAQ